MTIQAIIGVSPRVPLYSVFLVLLGAFLTSCQPILPGGYRETSNAAPRRVIVSEPIFVSPNDGTAVPYRRTRIVTLP